MHHYGSGCDRSWYEQQNDELRTKFWKVQDELYAYQRTWQTDWPTEEGRYWFYGSRWDGDDVGLRMIQVYQSVNPNGFHFWRYDGLTAMIYEIEAGPASGRKYLCQSYQNLFDHGSVVLYD